MTTRIFIDNVGEFHIQNEKLSEVLSFLNQIQAVKGKNPESYVQEVIAKNFQGRELLRD